MYGTNRDENPESWLPAEQITAHTSTEVWGIQMRFSDCAFLDVVPGILTIKDKTWISSVSSFHSLLHGSSLYKINRVIKLALEGLIAFLQEH